MMLLAVFERAVRVLMTLSLLARTWPTSPWWRIGADVNDMNKKTRAKARVFSLVLATLSAAAGPAGRATGWRCSRPTASRDR